MMLDKSVTKKQVFSFTEGDGRNKQLLGGKGANLCEMTQIGLNVPPGFVISTEACLDYLASETDELPQGLMEAVREQMRVVEAATGKGFGNPENPLLVSVRSGSAMSMPGMMDTILNLGLNDQTVEGLVTASGDAPVSLHQADRQRGHCVAPASAPGALPAHTAHSSPSRCFAPCDAAPDRPCRVGIHPTPYLVSSGVRHETQ